MTAVARPRILLVTRNLPPLMSGMDRLNWHMAGEKAKVGQVRVVGRPDSAALVRAGIEVREAPVSRHESYCCVRLRTARSQGMAAGFRQITALTDRREP